MQTSSRRIAFIAVIGIFLAVGAVAAIYSHKGQQAQKLACGEIPAAGGNVYRNCEYGFEFDYPNDYQMEYHNRDGAWSVYVSSPAEREAEGGYDVFSVTVKKIPADFKNLEALFSDEDGVKISRIKIDGADAIRADYPHHDGYEMSTDPSEIALQSNGFLYYLKTSVRGEPDTERLISSFRLLPL